MMILMPECNQLEGDKMSKPSKNRLEKKKNRELKNKKKVLMRRKKIREEASENKRIKKIEKDSEPKQQPFSNVAKVKTPEEIAKQIEHNFEVLMALENEYAKEMAEREGLNKALEEEGYTTLKEKMDYLNKKAEEETKEIYEKRIKDAIN